MPKHCLCGDRSSTSECLAKRWPMDRPVDYPVNASYGIGRRISATPSEDSQLGLSSDSTRYARFAHLRPPHASIEVIRYELAGSTEDRESVRAVTNGKTFPVCARFSIVGF